MTKKPRIAPIERPTGLFTRAAYWLTQKKLGRVITPAQVIYARYPSLFTWVKKISDFQDSEIPLDGDLKLLVKYYTAWLNGCDFCKDLGEYLADGSGMSVGKLRSIGSFRESDQFTEEERAVLEFTEQANNRLVSDAAFERLKQYFNDKQIIGISYIVATENYFNIMNGALGIGSDGLCSISTEG